MEIGEAAGLRGSTPMGPDMLYKPPHQRQDPGPSQTQSLRHVSPKTDLYDLHQEYEDDYGHYDDDDYREIGYNRYVNSTIHKFDTKGRQQLLKALVSLDTVIKNCLSHRAECVKCKSTTTFEMIADSGASLTFTHTKKDLQEFEKVDDNDFTVETASSNNPLKVKGVGCIFLEHDVQGTHFTKRVVTRLYPVYFIPGLSIRLLSIGQLLSQGLELWGNSSLLQFKKPNGRVILTCHPHQPGQTIYWLSGCLANDQSLLALSTVYSVDYDIMHRQFAHPSKDVL